MNYVPRKEAGILLFTSLKGELEEEMEDAPVDSIYCPTGIDFILDTIRKAVETRSVHLKRKLLSDYEHIYRTNGESMRAYVNRYQRTERSLLSVGIEVCKMYDAESRGARLLERSKLSHELQRQVLIGTQQTLVFDTVKDVLLFQYPDHRPPPQIMGAFGPRDDAPRRDQHQQRPYRPWGKGKGDSKGHKGGGKPDARRQVYATETTDLPDTDNQEDISLEQEEDDHPGGRRG